MSKNRLQTKLLAGFLVLAAWLTSLCLLMEPSHACCQQARHAIQKTLPPCCVIDNASAVLDHASSHGFPPVDFSAFPAFDYQHLLNFKQTEISLSRQELAHVPDQSDRYLDLRVLLN